MQHPSAVKVREEITRLSKRLKPAEKELEAERKRHSEQQAAVKRIRGDLSKIVAGTKPCPHPRSYISWPREHL